MLRNIQAVHQQPQDALQMNVRMRHPYRLDHSSARSNLAGEEAIALKAVDRLLLLVQMDAADELTDALLDVDGAKSSRTGSFLAPMPHVPDSGDTNKLQGPNEAVKVDTIQVTDDDVGIDDVTKCPGLLDGAFRRVHSFCYVRSRCAVLDEYCARSIVMLKHLARTIRPGENEARLAPCL